MNGGNKEKTKSNGIGRIWLDMALAIVDMACLSATNWVPINALVVSARR